MIQALASLVAITLVLPAAVLGPGSGPLILYFGRRGGVQAQIHIFFKQFIQFSFFGGGLGICNRCYNNFCPPTTILSK